VLLGGAVMGVLSALPIINAANVCCCLWVIAGGLTAAYLLQQNQITPITPADGAIVGLLAGLAGALIHFVVSIPIDLVLAPFQRGFLENLRESMPPEAAAMLSRYLEERESAGAAFLMVQRVIGLIFTLFIGAIFSTLGGLLGAAVFRKPPSPPGVIDIPPSE